MEIRSLHGKKAERLDVSPADMTIQGFGRIERGWVEGKGAREWVLSPASKVKKESDGRVSQNTCRS